MSRPLKTVLSTVAVLAVGSFAAADTIRVCQGSSCEYSDIQEAINAASDGDVIEIAAGTYYPSRSINTFGKAVTLRGASGKGKDFAPMTIIDGRDVIRVLICSSGETENTRFENLFIQHGQAEDGAGILCNGSNPTIENCTFRYNLAYNSGGGVHCNISSPRLENCTFTSNAADGGGGLYNSLLSNTRVINCTFEYNLSEYGAGLLNLGNKLMLEHCLFLDNTADRGGGIYNLGASSTFENCAFIGNSAVYEGGALNCYGSNPSVHSCTFKGNSALIRGGALYSWYSNPTFENSTFSRNSAEYGGGMFNDSSASMLTDCSFTECCKVDPPSSIIDAGGNDYESWCEACRADVNCDKTVNGIDLELILSAWNTPEAQYDLDGDNLVGGRDLGILLGTWGTCR